MKKALKRICNRMHTKSKFVFDNGSCAAYVELVQPSASCQKFPQPINQRDPIQKDVCEPSGPTLPTPPFSPNLSFKEDRTRSISVESSLPSSPPSKVDEEGVQLLMMLRMGKE